MRVIAVTGGRHYEDTGFAHELLDRLHAMQRVDLLLHGGADGADSIAGSWALYHARPPVRVRVFDAEWAKYGTKAGPIRNRRMLEDGEPELLVAFPGGFGTTDCVRQARQMGIPVVSEWADTLRFVP